MNRKLIILDLDGTTLNSAGQITPMTKMITRQIANRGHVISIMTGRPYREAKQFYQQLGLTSPIVTFNGGLCFVPGSNWSGEYQITFNRQIALQIMKYRASLGITTMTAEDGSHLLARNYRPLPRSFYQNTLGFFPQHLPPQQILSSVNLTFNPICMAIKTQPHYLPKVNRFLADRYHGIIRTAPWGAYDITEIAAKHVNKVTGIKRLARAYHINRKDIIAFGDRMNDSQMLQFVGHGVAIKNALPELKAVADGVTRYDHNHDGVAHYLKHYFHLKNL